MKLGILLSAAIVSVSLFTRAEAEEGLYFGVGIAATDIDSFDGDTAFGGFGQSSTGNATRLGLTMGYRKEYADFFYAGEIDGDFRPGTKLSSGGFTCDEAISAPYYCSNDATLRLRAMVGSDLGKGFEGFGTLGLAFGAGTAATSVDSVDRGINAGLTLGAGVQRRLASGAKLRAELIYDRMDASVIRPRDETGTVFDGTPYSPELDTFSLKFTYIFGR